MSGTYEQPDFPRPPAPRIYQSYNQLMEKARNVGKRANMEEQLQAVIHELRVHQEQIRVQNAQLLAAQRALEQSRDRYASLYDFAPIGYATFDKNGVVLEINLTGCRLLGLERASIVGYPFIRWLSDPNGPDFISQLQNCLRQETNTWEACLLHALQRTIPVRITATAEHRDHSVTFRAVITDLTEERRACERAAVD